VLIAPHVVVFCFWCAVEEAKEEPTEEKKDEKKDTKKGDEVTYCASCFCNFICVFVRCVSFRGTSVPAVCVAGNPFHWNAQCPEMIFRDHFSSITYFNVP
jgi:hypothetical protein